MALTYKSCLWVSAQFFFPFCFGVPFSRILFLARYSPWLLHCHAVVAARTGRRQGSACVTFFFFPLVGRVPCR